MSKVYGTRKEKAARLLELVRKGPSFHANIFDAVRFSPEEAGEQYKLWSKSWVIGLVIELVPELKKLRNQDGATL